MFMTKSEELVNYLTEEALYFAEKAIRKEKVFYDDFDEWQGVIIPEELGGGEWDINISVYGEPCMRATAYPYHMVEHEGRMFQEMNTDASVALLCLEVTKGEEE
jgi:hypothetical protein